MNINSKKHLPSLQSCLDFKIFLVALVIEPRASCFPGNLYVTKSYPKPLKDPGRLNSGIKGQTERITNVSISEVLF